MTYVNGAVIAVPTDNRQAYLELAQTMAAYFKSRGALRCVECWEQDVPGGEKTSFPMAVQKKDGESVVLAWIEWPSREVADRAMAEMAGNANLDDMPFDGSRMIFGGFDIILDT